MKIFKLLLLVVTLTCAMPAFADPGPSKKCKRIPKKEWMARLTQYKHEFLTKKLNLTPKQQAAFFALYDAKDRARFEAEKKVRMQVDALRKKGDAATDAELLKSVNDQYNIEIELDRIEKEYMQKFKKVLTARQLFKLKHVEREFQKQLIEHRPPRK